MKVWISFIQNDREFVFRLKEFLLNHGQEVLTLDHNLSAGENIVQRISESISSSDVFIIIFSKQYSKSSWLTVETNLIITQVSTNQNKKFIPIVIDKGVQLPSYIMNYAYIDYTNGKSFDENSQHILQSVESHANLSIKSLNQIQKSLNDALKNQERMLKVEKDEYYSAKRKKMSLTVYGVVMVLTTLLTATALNVYLSKENNLDILNFNNFSLFSFFLGVIVTGLSIYVLNLISRRKE